MLYTSVYTIDLTEIPDVFDRGILYYKVNQFRKTPFIIGHWINQIKTEKEDGNERFSSNHFIIGGNRLPVYFIFTYP